MQVVQGLTQQEVRARQQRGETKLALALAIIYVVVLVTPITANYFGLVTPGIQGSELKVMLVTLPLWFLIMRLIWRLQLFDRLLTVGDRV